MVVATGARHGQPEEATSQGVDAVVELVGGGLGGVGVLVILRSEPEEAEGDAAVVRRLASFFKLVTGELELDEAIVGEVVVERSDHPVAIAISARVWLGGESVRLVLGVSSDVEPITSPTLPVVWRGEQAFDDAVKSVRRGIGEKVGDFLGSGGKSD